MMGGYVDEARAFRDWLLRAIAGDPADLQIMYSIDGARRLTEFELDWLPGYEGSKPVRVGNAASGQFQLDVYGEVMSAIYAARRLGMPETEGGWIAAKEVLAFLEDAWQRPDDGIWEVRGGRRHFTHSKVMAWVAIDRLVRSIQELGMGGDEGQGHAARTWARCASASTPRSASAASTRASARSRSRTAASSSTPACWSSRTSGSCPAVTRASPARWRRSRRSCCATDSCSATAPSTAPTGCPAPRARSWRAASGWPTTTRSSAGFATPRRCSSGCSGCATTSACSPRSTSPRCAPDRQLPPGVLAPGAGRDRADHRGRRSAASVQRARARVRNAANVSLAAERRSDPERTRSARAQKRFVTARNVILSLVSRRRPASVRTKLHSRS